MNEIEKMYENAGFETEIVPCYSLNCEYFEVDKGYPPFTAEKQLELLKFLSKLDLYGEVILRDSFDECLVKVEILDPGFTLVEAYRNTLEEAIAAVINKRWEYLTEKQKQQIKGILE